jgi:hypothetical protein
MTDRQLLGRYETEGRKSQNEVLAKLEGAP